MTATTPPPAPPTGARLGAHLWSFVAFVVATPGAPQVRVRFRDVPHGWRWACDRCGRHPEPTCPHERAAAYITRTDAAHPRDADPTTPTTTAGTTREDTR